MSAKSEILHVDDDANDRLLVQLACARSDLPCVLRGASNGEEAIAYLSGDRSFEDRNPNPLPDLVLLDLKLPRKSGFEVLEWIRKNPNTQSIPVVILSSSAQDKDVLLARKLGASDYLVKPVSFRQMQKLMKEIAHHWLSAEISKA
jgi:CheY-like chemotaxis protein